MCAKCIGLLLEAPFVLRIGCSERHMQVPVFLHEFKFILYYSFSSTTGFSDQQQLQPHHQMQRQQLSKSCFTSSQYYVRSEINPLYHTIQSNFASLVERQVIHKTFCYLKFTNKASKHYFFLLKKSPKSERFFSVYVYLPIHGGSSEEKAELILVRKVKCLIIPRTSP